MRRGVNRPARIARKLTHQFGPRDRVTLRSIGPSIPIVRLVLPRRV